MTFASSHSLFFFLFRPVPFKMSSKSHFLKNDDLASLLIPDTRPALTATKGP